MTDQMRHIVEFTESDGRFRAVCISIPIEKFRSQGRDMQFLRTWIGFRVAETLKKGKSMGRVLKWYPVTEVQEA